MAEGSRLVATYDFTVLPSTRVALVLPAALVALMVVSALGVRAMITRGALDIPGHRSSHDTPTPRGGGVGVVLSFGIGLLTLAALHPGDKRLWAVLVATLLLAAVSHLDDVHQWRFTAKLAAQGVAALLAVGSGLVLPHPAGLGSYGAAAALTLLWLVFATNAVNFIDGLNGLASGSVALAALGFTLLSWQVGSGDGLAVLGPLALAAGIAGFLPFNFPRARIFLGDIGSQSIGFAVAALGLVHPASRSDAVLWMPLLLSGIYYDVVFTLVRRRRAGERLTEAHRGHLYQVARRAGMPATGVACVQFAFVAWNAGWLLGCGGRPAWPMLAALAVQMGWTALVVILARRSPIGRW